MVKPFSVILWSLLRILAMLTARSTLDPISMYCRSMTLSNKNSSPSSAVAGSPWAPVSLVISKELPDARTRPTRLRM
jgi:hypothetical protein